MESPLTSGDEQDHRSEGGKLVVCLLRKHTKLKDKQFLLVYTICFVYYRT